METSRKQEASRKCTARDEIQLKSIYKRYLYVYTMFVCQTSEEPFQTSCIGIVRDGNLVPVGPGHSPNAAKAQLKNKCPLGDFSLKRLYIYIKNWPHCVRRLEPSYSRHRKTLLTPRYPENRRKICVRVL